VTKLLVVDDDAAQLRTLSRALANRLRDVTLLTATSGAAAIELLQSTDVDVVLTDLQMPGMNGFELLAWMIEHAPHVPVLTMTAYWNPQAGERLRELGPTASFTKPLDLAAVAERIHAAAAPGIRGHVQNISLAAFLQLVGMEQKSCTLTVEQNGRTGYLHLRDGALVDASSGDLRGEEAAVAIVGWSAPGITIGPHAGPIERTIHQPLGFIVMEALRQKDEVANRESMEIEPDPDRAFAPMESRAPPPLASPAPPRFRDPLASSAPPRFRDPLVSSVPPRLLDPPASLAPPEASTPPRAREESRAPPAPNAKLVLPEETLALALVDSVGNLLWAEERRAMQVGAWARVASHFLAEQRKHAGNAVEEMMVSTSELNYVVRPLRADPSVFTLLLFEPAESSFARRRLDLDRLRAVLEKMGAGTSGA
jgi:CheY-like chemotaxis protein